MLISKYNPPKEAQISAEKALTCLNKGSNAMMSIGRARAKQLASGKPVSIVTVRKMARFNRHRKNKSYIGNPCEDNGYVAWEGWGGNAGIGWARRIVRNGK